jgi:hypothetical protein
MTGRSYEPLHRQRYRLRRSVTRDQFIVCPDWLEHGGVYEGDIDPSSQDYPDLRIRLLHPTNPDLTYLVEEGCLEEVD